MPQISVIIPARDAAKTLPRTLKALTPQRAAGDCEVIVVDNGSRDDTAAIAERAPVVDRVIRRERGQGPGAARTEGADVAQSDALAYLDADCWPAEGWLDAGLTALTHADLVQGRVLPDPDATTVGPFDRTLVVTAPYGLFETANLFVRRELVQRLGGFAEGLETTAPGARAGAPFGEDVVFGWRARRTGARTDFCAEALAYHAVTPRPAREFVAERARLALFPALAREVPELRDAFFYRRVFHSRRSAAFDAALLGVLLALVSRRALPLAAAAPYAALAAADARSWGRRQGPGVALAGLAADAVGAYALARGSVQAGALLL